MKNILIAGGTGFIGSNFVRYILNREKYIRVVNLDSNTHRGGTTHLSILPNSRNHLFIEGDPSDRVLLVDIFSTFNIDTVINFGSELHGERSENNPEEQIIHSINGTIALLDTANTYWRDHQAKACTPVRFHQVSTGDVIGSYQLNESPWIEKSPLRPNSPYLPLIIANDLLVQSFGDTYDFPYTLTRSSNNYGPFQSQERWIPKVILNAIEGVSLPIIGDREKARDWLHVQDYCEAIHLVLKKGKIRNYYNISSGSKATNLFIVETICEILDELSPNFSVIPHKKLISTKSDYSGYYQNCDLDSQKSLEELEWKPHINLIEGLRTTVEWYLENIINPCSNLGLVAGKTHKIDVNLKMA